jgi:DNA-binding CsgD family transcriptional regulator
VPAHALRGLAAYRDGDLDTARAEADRADQARAACPVPPRPRAVPEHAILAAAVGRGGGAGALRELVAGGLGTDRTMTAFALLVLADVERDREPLAAADALLGSFPTALGLVDFRDEVAASLDGGGPPLAAAEPLTDRERAVLQYLRSDLSLAEIAAHLYVSVNTVKTHARHVYRKLGVTGRRQLTRTAP